MTPSDEFKLGSDEIKKLIECNRILMGACEESIKYANELSGFRGKNPAILALQKCREILGSRE